VLRTLLLSFSILLSSSLGAQENVEEQVAPENPVVVLQTSEGDITLELFADKAPITVENFLGYVDSGFYEGTIFHRVIPNFMIQGGGFDKTMQKKTTNPPIKNESKNRMHNTRGTIAMARTNDPDSATAQFFINHRSNLQLDWAPGREGYAVFGEVIDGMDVVDYIAAVETARKGSMGDVPTETIIIESVERKNL